MHGPRGTALGIFQKQLSLLGNTAIHHQSEAQPWPEPSRELGYLSREQPHGALGLGLILQEPYSAGHAVPSAMPTTSPLLDTGR